MTEKYNYDTQELIDIVNELIVWRDGLEKLNNGYSNAIMKRLDAILDLKKIEDVIITKDDVKKI